MFNIKTDDPELQHLFDLLTPEEREQLFIEQWIANPNDHRIRIVEMLIGAGLAHWALPHGIAFDIGNDAARLVAGLVELVGGDLEEPFDEDRTIDDYARDRSVQ